MKKKIGIILVVTNEKHHLRLIYNSLLKQTYENFRIYFIDNNSKDDSQSYSEQMNKELHLDIKYITLKENSGFAKGNNIGANLAVKDGCDYLFILNPDMELDTKCLGNLVKYADTDKNLGVLSPIVLYGIDGKRTDKIQSYADEADFSTGQTISIHSGMILGNNYLPDSIEVNTIHGGSTFMKTEVYNKIGLFNEDNFIYGDEIDLAYRVKNAGYKMLVTKEAKSWHFHDWSKKNKKGYYFQYYYMMRNRFLFFYRYNKFKSLIITALKELFYFPIKIRWAIRVADIKLLKYYYLGISHGLLKKTGKANINFDQL